jgi:hypothetical protein
MGFSFNSMALRSHGFDPMKQLLQKYPLLPIKQKGTLRNIRAQIEAAAGSKLIRITKFFDGADSAAISMKKGIALDKRARAMPRKKKRGEVIESLMNARKGIINIEAKIIPVAHSPHWLYLFPLITGTKTQHT